MNSLSWFIYFADVLPAFASGVTFTFFFILVGSVFLNAFQILELGVKKYLWITILSVVILIVNNLIPSQTTLYAIAASELGEDVYKSEQGQKIVKQLSDWIDAQVKPK